MTTQHKSSAIDQQLIQMHNDNIPRKEKAKRLGLDISSVDRRRRLLKLSKSRNVTDEQRQLAMVLKREGKTTPEVSRLTGISETTIKDLWKKAQKPEVPTLSITELLKKPVNQFIASNWREPLQLNWQVYKQATVEEQP